MKRILSVQHNLRSLFFIVLSHGTGRLGPVSGSAGPCLFILLLPIAWVTLRNSSKLVLLPVLNFLVTRDTAINKDDTAPALASGWRHLLKCLKSLCPGDSIWQRRSADGYGDLLTCLFSHPDLHQRFTPSAYLIPPSTWS